MLVWRMLADIVAEHGAAALVRVHRIEGSAPREAGACLVLRPDGGFHGTIGGGQLEWQALATARQALASGASQTRFVDQALGPQLGQCCGGRVVLQIETFGRADRGELAELARAEREGPFMVACCLGDDGRVQRELFPPPCGEGVAEGDGWGSKTQSASIGSSTGSKSPWSDDPHPRPLPARGRRGTAEASSWTESYGQERTPLLLFGAGHVGRALVLALAPLPFAVRWIDSRPDAFPGHGPPNTKAVLAQDPVGELATADPSSFVIVMTHEHPLDLAITAAALQGPFPFVGLIGSRTKRARFETRFRALGIDAQRIAALACPIGLPAITGKEPAVIAASAAAQLLIERERLALRPIPDVPSTSADENDRALTGR